MSKIWQDIRHQVEYTNLNLHILLWFSRLPQIQIFRNVFSASPTLLKKFFSSHLRQFNGFCPGVKNAMKRSIEGHSIRSSVVLSYSLLYVLTFFQPFSIEFHIHFSIKARAFNFLKRGIYTLKLWRVMIN